MSSCCWSFFCRCSGVLRPAGSEHNTGKEYNSEKEHCSSLHDFLHIHISSHLFGAISAPCKNIIVLKGKAIGEPVSADLSCTSPHCISHKRRIAETWDPVWGTGNNAFQVPIYRPWFSSTNAPLRLVCACPPFPIIDR